MAKTPLMSPAYQYNPFTRKLDRTVAALDAADAAAQIAMAPSTGGAVTMLPPPPPPPIFVAPPPSDPMGSAGAVQANLTAHIVKTVNAHQASAISSIAAGGLAAVDVQSALNELDTEKANVTLAIITDANANRTLALGDELAKWIRMTNGAANTVTVPANATVAFAIGSQINGTQAGAGQTTITPAVGVTVNGTPSLLTRAQFSCWTLIKVNTNEWDLAGDLA